MNTEYPSLEDMSGEGQRAPRLDINEVRIDGKKGTYSYVKTTEGVQDLPNGKKGFAKEDLGENIKVVFLKIRRKLRWYRKEEKTLTTNEHNSKADMLTLFGGESIVKGTNDELKAKYPSLRTVQIVYALLLRDGGMNELVRLIVKGASLGSKTKAKDVHDFYSYISSFKTGGKDDHFYEYVTELGCVEETSDLGEYYAMTFNQGNKLPDVMIATDVTENMRKVFDFAVKSDEYYKTKDVEQIKKETEKQPELDTIEYPEGDDEVSLEDIPF